MNSRYARPLTAEQRAFLNSLDTECGTNDGWLRHRRRHETPCADCNQARTAYEAAKCGTYAGVKIHTRKHEPLCPACSIANAAYQQAQRAAKPEQYRSYQKAYYDQHAVQRRAATARRRAAGRSSR